MHSNIHSQTEQTRPLEPAFDAATGPLQPPEARGGHPQGGGDAGPQAGGRAGVRPSRGFLSTV